MVLAVGAIVLVDAVADGARWRVLVVQRARPPRAGTWSLPGGHVEPGESLAEATRREVREETALDVTVLEETEVFTLAGEGLTYAIHEHLCVPVDPAAPIRAGDDARDARWATPDELEALGVSPEARAVVERASERRWRLPRRRAP